MPLQAAAIGLVGIPKIGLGKAAYACHNPAGGNMFSGNQAIYFLLQVLPGF